MHHVFGVAQDARTFGLKIGFEWSNVWKKKIPLLKLDTELMIY